MLRLIHIFLLALSLSLPKKGKNRGKKEEVHSGCGSVATSGSQTTMTKVNGANNAKSSTSGANDVILTESQLLATNSSDESVVSGDSQMLLAPGLNSSPGSDEES